MSARTPRIACVNLPHIAIALAERDDSTLAGRPVVVQAPPPGPQAVYDVSYAAHLAGVSRGMTLTQARKACPELTVLPARPDDYRDTLMRVLAVLADFTAQVEPADLEHSWLAATELVPRGGRERSLAEALTTRVRRETGLPSRVGLAHGKLTSRIVTDYLRQRDVMVLPVGREVAFLGGLAVRYLPLSARKQQRLGQLGLTKVRQYAALPSSGILPRFGYEGLRAHRLANGHDDPRVVPWRETPPVEAEHVFPEPIANHRTLRDHLERLARKVARPLAAQFQLAGALRLRITFEDGQVEEQTRTLVTPTGSATALMTHVDGLMDRVTWHAPVERVALAARGLCPTVGRQLELFRSANEANAEITAVLKRIQAKYGPEVVRRGHTLEPDSPLHERRAYLAPWG